MKSFLFLIAALMTQAAVAETVPTAGSANLRASGIQFDFGYDIQRAGQQVKGSTFNRGYTIVNLTQGENGWTGRFGDLVISRAIVKPTNNPNKSEIEIAALPAGIFNYTLSKNKKGDWEISGMTPTGRINRGTLKADGSQMTAGTNFSYDMSLKRDRKKEYLFDGTLIIYNRMGTMRNGFATLNAKGSLDPKVAIHDPALYTILYILPFSR